MSIQDVIERARHEPPYSVPNTRVILECRTCDRVTWSKSELEHDLALRLPAELVALWNECGGLHLYEDKVDGQWGLVVLSPAELVKKNREYREDREDDALGGDLVFARFRGDADVALMRNDESASDYGTIVVVPDIGPRDEWHTAGRTLEEFLMRFMDARGSKYWE